MPLTHAPRILIVATALAAPSGCFLPDWDGWPGHSTSHGEFSTLGLGESAVAGTSGALGTGDATTLDAATSGPPTTGSTTFESTTVDAPTGPASSSGISTTEIAPECGNGVVEDLEECDDGNADKWDECTAGCISTHRSCSPAVPGDPNCGAIDLYCIAEDTCGGCQQLAATTCSDIDAALPVCESETGLCRECTASDDSACEAGEFCHPYEHTCGDCTDHSQCPSHACQELFGCVSPTDVVWVQKQLVDCDSKDGTPENPYCEVQTALAKSLATAILVKPGSGPMELPIVIAGRDVVLVGVVGDGEEYPEISGAKIDGPIVSVSDHARVSLDRLRITGSKSGVVAVRCEGSPLKITRSVISNNGGGLEFIGCVWAGLDRTLYKENQGAISVKSAGMNTSLVEISNTFIVKNDAGALAPIFVANDNLARIKNLTILDNHGDYSSTFGCTGSGHVQLNNSVVLADDAEEKCDAWGQGNVFAAAADAPLLFLPPIDGVYRPTPTLKDTATWYNGDPYVDFDGDARPNVHGAPDYAGADRPAK